MINQIKKDKKVTSTKIKEFSKKKIAMSGIKWDKVCKTLYS